MKLTVLSLLFFFSCTITFGQKPLITLDTYKTWTGAYRGDISDNGRYAIYTIVNEPLGSGTLVITETSGKELFRKIGGQDAKFTANSEYLVAQLPGDSILLYNLKSKKATYINSMRAFKLANWRKNESLFLSDVKGNLLVHDFHDKHIFKTGPVSQYEVAPDGSGLITVGKDSVNGLLPVNWIDASNKKARQIYSASSPSSFIFDGNANQIAFIDYSASTSIVHYSVYKGKFAVIVYASDSLDISTGQYWRFSQDGKWLFFSVTSRASAKKKATFEGLEIWSYQDNYLRSYYNGTSIFGDNISQRPHIAILNIQTKQVKQLTSGSEKIVELTLKPETENYCIIETLGELRSERWPDGRSRSYYLCNTISGDRSPLEIDQLYPLNFWNISPRQRFAVYYKIADTSYYTIEIANMKRHQITAGIGKDLVRYDKRHYPHWNYYAAGMLGWLPGDNGILVNGSYNIWAVDPLGIRPPKNITDIPGKHDQFVFSKAGKNTMGTFTIPKSIIMSAFNLKTKDFGFFRFDANGTHHPIKLSIRKWYLADAYSPLTEAVYKATSGGYLLRAETADSSGNYYFSKDLKHFNKVSDVYPEQKYNWLTTELHTYKDVLGNELQGILYKPQNFDPSKKYPIIFTVYEFQSNKLNSFPRPELHGAVIMEPWMISNGYLVFAPDLKSSPRFGGDAVLRSIQAGIDHLSQYKWVDTAHMGISGHSVGGFVTNYTVSHNGKFKAAVSGAGISDMIRAASDLWEDGAVKQEFLKDAVYMMDTDLLSDQKAYMRNSPILSSKNVRTPILLIHNDHDGSVRFEQSRAFFIALRSLQKPCWWLNYIGQGHAVSGTKYEIDYNNRVKEFYDHYLKGAPMPDWMREHL